MIKIEPQISQYSWSGYVIVSDLATDVANAGATVTSLMVSSAQTISSDLTIPTTCSSTVIKGGITTIAAGKTVTFNGPFSAGLYQAFILLSGSNIVTNGTFSSDLTGWAGADWAQSAGTALHTADTGHTAALIQAAATVTSGVTYKLTFDIVGMTAGTLTPSCGGVTGRAYDANGTHVRTFVASATTALAFTPTATFDGAIDNVSLVAMGAVVFGEGSTTEVSAAWFGLSETATDAVNAAALQAAIDSKGPRIIMPSGSFGYNTGIIIDRSMIFDGAGSSIGWITSDSNTTQLSYNGTGVGITLVAVGVNGQQNFHLSNFLLMGTVAAVGGISFGSGADYVINSSLRNIQISYFTKSGAYGLRLCRGYLSCFENIITTANYDGIVSLSGDLCTTLRFNNVCSNGNYHRGYHFAGSIIESSFVGLAADSNAYEGLYIYGSGFWGNDFYSFVSEANQISGGTAPIVITGSGGDGSPYYNNFWGGVIQDNVGGVYIALDYCTTTTFNNVILGSYAAGFMSCTANTLYVLFNTGTFGVPAAYVTGNHVGGVSMGFSSTESQTLIADNAHGWASPYRAVTGHINFASTGTWRTVAIITFASTDYGGGYLMFSYGGVEAATGAALAVLIGTFVKDGAGNPAFTSITNSVANCTIQAVADGDTQLVIQMKSSSGANAIFGNFSFVVMGSAITTMTVTAPGYSD